MVVQFVHDEVVDVLEEQQEMQLDNLVKEVVDTIVELQVEEHHMLVVVDKLVVHIVVAEYIVVVVVVHYIDMVVLDIVVVADHKHKAVLEVDIGDY